MRRLRARKRETHPLDVLLASYSCLNDPEWSSDESPAYPRGSGQLVAVSKALRRDYSKDTCQQRRERESREQY